MKITSYCSNLCCSKEVCDVVSCRDYTIKEYIEEREVKVFEMNKRCDVCDSGYMLPTGQILTSSPVQYTHICNNEGCSAVKTYFKAYPHYEYR